MSDPGGRPVVLVTGASRGIGQATAELAAASGWDVAVGYRADAERAQAVVSACQASGAQAIAVQGDLALEQEVARVFAEVDAAYGRLDALVANVGIVAPLARVEDFDAERIERVLRVNVRRHAAVRWRGRPADVPGPRGPRRRHRHRLLPGGGPGRSR